MMGHPCRAGRWMPLLGILLCILGSRTGRPRYTALVSVALTRQAGENVKLQKALEQALAEAQLKAQLVEVPCIEHAAGPDLQELEALLSSKTEVEEVVLLTSPEAARVFGEAWRAARSPTCRVASVGKGTSVGIPANLLNDVHVLGVQVHLHQRHAGGGRGALISHLQTIQQPATSAQT
eukprot:g19093.t1